MGDKIARLFNEHMLMRRLALVWALGIITMTVYRATDPEILVHISGPGASVVVGIIGLLSTVLWFYTGKSPGNDE